jgi:ABC-2 type transport system permease protein
MQYNQTRALKAISKASLLAILKNPGSVFFSLLFPLVFVWIFGSFNSNGLVKIDIAFDKNSDTANLIYQILPTTGIVKIKQYTDDSIMKIDLEKGRLAAVINIVPNKQDSITKYTVKLKATNATTPEVMQLTPILENIIFKVSNIKNLLYSIEKNIYEVRAYKQIDFILPGQIGFSILFATLFGIAFTFYNLREQLVLKRFYATPVKKLNILVGIGFSRIVFQLLNVIVLIVVGKFWLGFTLANGWITFIEMLLLTIIMLLLLMGVGFLFSSIVKTDSTIPLLINLFALPQMLLSGTFFSINVFPSWMQVICKILPLTHFNTAMRKLSFEGMPLVSVWDNILVIGIWLLVVYALVYKLFKWE